MDCDVNSIKQNIVKLTYFDFFLGITGGLFLTLAKHWGDFPVGNQFGYFLFGMRLYDPTFIPQDWYTCEVFHPHFAFGYLLYFLQFLGPLKIVTEISQFITMALLALGLWILCKWFCKYMKLVYIGIIVLISLMRSWDMGLGSQQLISGYFQPSEISSSFMVLGLALLFGRRYLTSGIFIGLGGLFHSAILTSYGPCIIMTAFATGIMQNRKSMLSFVIPIGLLWGIIFFVVSNATIHSTPLTIQTAAIFTVFRAPGDFIISNWPRNPTFCWLILTAIGAMAIFKYTSDFRIKTLRISFVTLIITTVIGVIQLTFFNISALSATMLWRATPIALLFGLIIILDCAIRIGVEHGKVQIKDYFFICTFFIACVLLINFGWYKLNLLFWLMAIPLSVGAAKIVYRFDKVSINYSKLAVTFISTVMIFLIILSVYRRKDNLYNYFYPSPSAHGELMKWVRENTLEDSIIVVHPEMGSFRILGRRAIVVDAALTPFMHDELLEWYQRLCDVCGFPVTANPTKISLQIMVDGYRYLDTARAKLLYQRFGANYVVVSAKEHAGDLNGLIEKYHNEDYCVFEIPSEENHEITFPP